MKSQRSEIATEVLRNKNEAGGIPPLILNSITKLQKILKYGIIIKNTQMNEQDYKPSPTKLNNI